MDKRQSYSFNPSRYTKLIQKSVNDVITQSEIMTRAICPRKWFYRYALLLERKGVLNYHFLYGNLLHGALAQLYKSGRYYETYKEYPIEIPKLEVPDSVILSPTDREEIEIVRAKVEVAFNAYRMHYYKEDGSMRVLSVEDTFRTKWRGLTLEGKIDMVAHPKLRDGIFIWDFKTAGRFDASMLDAWSFRFQFLYYCWLYWRCTGERPSGIMVNGLAKTQLRPKIVDKKTGRKESKEEYIKRIREDMQINREKYFYRQRMPLVAGILEKFEKEMLAPHVTAMNYMRVASGGITDSLAFAMNTNSCHVYNSFCEFLPLCKDGTLMLGEYQKRATKHEELKETEAEIGEG